MSGVFVNYRQRDGSGGLREHATLVELIAERLARHFGAGTVFFDSSLRIGERYPDELRARLEDSDVLVAVIHQAWLEDLDARRRGTGTDWVRYEIATALAAGKTVVPLLLDSAKLPDAAHLPLDIAEMTYRQTATIRFGRSAADLDGLIGELERHIAPAAAGPDVPLGAKAARPARRRTRWPGLLTLGAAALAVPIASPYLLFSPASAGAVWMAALAGISLAPLLGALGAVWGVYLQRERLDWVDRKLAEIIDEQRGLIVFGLVIAGLAVLMLMSNDALSLELRMLVFAVVIMIVLGYGVIWLRDREKHARWPPEHVAADPAAVRGAVVRLRQRLVLWSAPLSRHERDQARVALRQITDALAELRRDAAADRLSWLRSWPGLRSAVCTAWVCATVGTVSAALLSSPRARGVWWLDVLTAVGVLVACGIFLTTVEVSYRLQQWRKDTAVATATADVTWLERRLPDASTPLNQSAGNAT